MFLQPHKHACPAIRDLVPNSYFCFILSSYHLHAEISCWIYSSERQLARMRLAFLRSVLNQEVGAFDTDLTTDPNFLQLGHFVASFSTFFAGIIIAFASCWEVALLSFLVIPLFLSRLCRILRLFSPLLGRNGP